MIPARVYVVSPSNEIAASWSWGLDSLLPPYVVASAYYLWASPHRIQRKPKLWVKYIALITQENRI
jgi:hypothetical protein